MPHTPFVSPQIYPLRAWCFAALREILTKFFACNVPLRELLYFFLRSSSFREIKEGRGEPCPYFALRETLYFSLRSLRLCVKPFNPLRETI